MRVGDLWRAEDIRLDNQGSVLEVLQTHRRAPPAPFEHRKRAPPLGIHEAAVHTGRAASPRPPEAPAGRRVMRRARLVGIVRSLALYYGIPFRARRLARLYAPF